MMGGMMGGSNPAYNQSMMQLLVGAGLRQGLDMTNPLILQMMMQQMQQVCLCDYWLNILNFHCS